jgi:hypothetical protein
MTYLEIENFLFLANIIIITELPIPYALYTLYLQYVIERD